jgi:hypothetical protein
MNKLDQIRTAFGFAPKESAVSLGRGHGFPWRKEWLTESQLNHHVHIVGASGFGKTVLLSHIVQDRIAKGKGLLFVDLKGDRETIEQFNSFVRDAGRLQDLKVLSLAKHEASTGYYLLSRSTANQLRDKVMKAFEWSEEFYKNQDERNKCSEAEYEADVVHGRYCCRSKMPVATEHPRWRERLATRR